MRLSFSVLGVASQAGCYLVGGLVILLALAAMATGLRVTELTGWAWQVLGFTFLALLIVLVFIALFCWVKLGEVRDKSLGELWLTAGVQAANGVATLALTYTLLGISLGIGSLAGQALTPDSVQGVIQGLTERFSMAFMTTIIGLPASALLRAMLLVAGGKVQKRLLTEGHTAD